MNDVERHEALIPMGTQVSSKGRWRFCRNKPGGPKWVDTASNANVYDENGKPYIDLTAGLGALTLGHRARMKAGGEPQSFPLPSRYELALADKIQEMIPWARRMRFMKNGGDATSAAVRLARIYTGRDSIIDFGSYHGCQDPWITDDHAGVPAVIRNLTTRIPPTIENIELVDETAACVILEAAPLHPLPDQFLAQLRRRCHRMGAVLIFDDVISGFRAHPQGAAGLTGVYPDLTCAGKAMANRHPISVVYGDADIMSCWERTHLSATHWAEPSAMNAAVENLNTMITEQFWDKQAAWSFGGLNNNGYWSVLALPPDEQTFVQSKLLDRGIISNLSQFYYLDLEPHRVTIERGFAEALGELQEVKTRGDDIASILDCDVNVTTFKRT